MKETFYQVVWEDSNGATFRVNGSIGKTESEAISLCSNHHRVKSGDAKILYVDSWEAWVD